MESRWAGEMARAAARLTPREGVELITVLLDLVDGGRVALVDDPSHLRVDQLHRVLGDLGAPERIHRSLVEDGDRADLTQLRAPDRTAGGRV